jgi:uncharacterized membrane protein YkvA (DUF1232 family)
MRNSISTWYRNILRHPKYRWWLIIGSLIYLLSPVDLIPDAPFIGWIDDGVIATLLVTELSQLFLERLKTGRRNQSEEQPTADSTGRKSAKTVDVDAMPME